MLKFFKKKELYIEELKREALALSDENVELKKTINNLEEKIEEMNKAVNILQNEKNSKTRADITNKKKWLYGYHDEEYGEGEE